MKNTRKNRKKLYIRLRNIGKKNGTWDLTDTLFIFRGMPSEEFARINWKKPHSKKSTLKIHNV